MPDLAGERVDYAGEQLLENAVPAEPYALFDRWLAAAFQAKEDGLLPEPTAMVVATSADGRPSARTVLLKEVGPTGFTSKTIPAAYRLGAIQMYNYAQFAGPLTGDTNSANNFSPTIIAYGLQISSATAFVHVA